VTFALHTLQYDQDWGVRLPSTVISHKQGTSEQRQRLASDPSRCVNIPERLKTNDARLKRATPDLLTLSCRLTSKYPQSSSPECRQYTCKGALPDTVHSRNRSLTKPLIESVVENPPPWAHETIHNWAAVFDHHGKASMDKFVTREIHESHAAIDMREVIGQERTLRRPRRGLKL